LTADQLALVGWGPAGFHDRCRHSLQPLKPSWIDLAEGDLRRTFGANSEVNKEFDSDTTRPKFSLADLAKLPATERANVLKNGFRLI
jgi:hypothetical protein